MGLSGTLSALAIMVTAFTVCTPLDQVKNLVYSQGTRWPTVFDPFEKPGDIRRATEASFPIEARDAYLEYGNEKPVWFLLYSDIHDKDSEEFLPTWHRLHRETDPNNATFVMLDAYIHRSIGWADQFKFKHYQVLPHLYYLRDGKWYASKTLAGAKLLKSTSGNNIDPLLFFADKGWEMAQSGELPPAASKEEMRRCQILRAVVKAVILLRRQMSNEAWVLSCVVFCAVMFVMGDATEEDKAAKKAKKEKKDK
mmetsp:Transcript_13830/g.16665  ORF Transcript_13830/g.16665 Transcript_13830/m.16665 type:complete len:253 (+) Transcript_13830:114-872(+)|eukprot:CAMPEP_0197848926 /NCGR_PEP_ID=MMETSP1438-20131217/10526_1 /TAXON_ID=1461541 /ORGANISM="Pterosperma sp., Strain CCMP1384" /LENGTH=252 /DNA_ID=CAMNT_0043461405 /DNA_START=114 /DNA_END=872 /DNA_ORIENTATION=+